MNANVSDRSNEELDLKDKVLKRMRQVVVQTLVIAVIVFVSAGRLDWVWAWAYLGAGLGILALNLAILPRELMAERGQPSENVKGWDRVLTSLTLFPILGLLTVAGLDERFDWSPQLSVAFHLVSLTFIVLGQGLFSWAMASNKFFSTVVRIQEERGHLVATGGPYRYARHPGYVGMMVSLIATGLALGSLWSLMPAALATLLITVRAALEDRTLQEELPGYAEYARRVRYRLLPGVW
jgi:protein-S-isoprenylcysteine O-methyltransferase Ste14